MRAALMSAKRKLLLAGLLSTTAVLPVARAQAPADSGPVIRTETKLVLVDTVVTDKKGNYIRDLEAKDFKVWEDNKEQQIKTFSFEAGNASPSNPQKHYLVLFFDNSTMDFGQQALARQAAAKFIDSNGGPSHLMAIVNFTGALQIAQNFTDNTQRLKNVVNGVKFSTVDPNASDAGAPTLNTQMASFGARDVLYALKDLAKSLTSIPGRKTVIMITGGFPLTPEIMSEATATISACNKANVAIYPIDVRGLVAGTPQARLTAPDSGVRFVLASYMPAGMAFFIPQHGPGGGGGGGGSHPGGGSGGGAPGGTGGGSHPGGGAPGGGAPGGGSPGRGPTGSPTGGRTGATGGGGPGLNPYGMNSPWSNPSVQSRMIIPQIPETTATNQNIMFMLAAGTGGFVIHETNDLMGGMQKIGKEQDEYYILGYTPPDSEEGSCHTLRVKVDHGDEVRARTGYCNSKPQDLLAGNSTEKELETRAVAAQAGNVAASMQLPFFYTAPNVARVNVAMEIDTQNVKFEKQKGKYHATVNVLGLAYLPDGSVGARFSDALKLDFEDKKMMEAFKEEPMHYESQFDIASGKYNLKVVFASSGESFGKVEMPLVVDPYDANQFAVSGLALSKHVQRASDLGTGLDALLLEDRVPLIADGMQLIPSGTNHLKKTDLAAFYFELYEPLLVTADPKKPPVVAFSVRVLDGKTGEQKDDTGLMRVALPKELGSPMVPVGIKIPTASLTPGPYKVEVKAVDDAGKEFKRTTDILID